MLLGVLHVLALSRVSSTLPFLFRSTELILQTHGPNVRWNLVDVGHNLLVGELLGFNATAQLQLFRWHCSAIGQVMNSFD